MTIHMNENRILNQAIGRLLKQGEYASFNGTCQYITNKGTKCAVGILLTDDEANKFQSYGNASIDDVMNDHPSIIPGWMDDALLLLRDMQQTHDDGAINDLPFQQMVLNMSELETC